MTVELSLTREPIPPQRSKKLLPPVAHVQNLWRRFPMASQGFLSLVDQAIVSATSFATAVIINRATQLDNVGLYYLTLSIVSIAVGIHEHVIAAPFMIYSSRRQGAKLAEYTGSTWIHHLVLTAVSILVLLAAIVGLTLSGSTAVVPGLWALLLAGPLMLLREWIRRIAFANLEMLSAIAIDSTVSFVQLSGLLLLAYFGGLSIYAIYGVMAGACALACLGWCCLNSHTLRFDRSQFMPDWVMNWSFASWAVRSYLLGNITPVLMPWILTVTVGTATTGMFGACATLIGITNMFMGAQGRVLIIRGAQAFVVGGAHELRRVLLWGALVLTSVLGTFCLFVVLTGPRLAVWVYGEQFDESGPILAALAISALITGLGQVAGNGLWAIELPRLNILADFCGLSVTLIAAMLLVSPYGAFGGALAMLAGATSATVVRALTLRRTLNSYSIELDAPPLTEAVT